MTAFDGLRIKAVIPALDEELAIAAVIASAPRFLCEIIVVDNGSRDQTADVAAAAGARVVSAPRRGYGRACKAGVAAALPCDILLFMDADGADDPADSAAILAPIVEGRADLVIGSRMIGRAEAGALTLPQRWGNALACALIAAFWGVRFTDLGPFRAIRTEALQKLAMDDEGFGWTVEMQARAAKMGLRVVEVPAAYRRRVGVSKISGTVRGVVSAGATILYIIFRERFRDGPLTRRRLP
ncbi:MAG: glycosyltransferase family 2 protein [Parvularculaceae bacterium]|nr:glycosyltransferase family 2 protein [Parvularculaceae bacterium]